MPQPHGQRRIARNLRPRPDDDYCNTRECIPAGAPPQGRYPAIHPADLPADIVLPRLIGVQRSTNGWTALCPAHPDENPSLSVAETAEGNLLVKCFRDCTAEEIMEAIGLQLQYLFASGYAKAMAQRHERHAGGGSRGLLARSRYAPGRPSPARLAALQDRYTEATAGATHLDCLGRELGGLPAAALRALGVGFEAALGAWIFPERDARGGLVGLVRRYPDGRKRCVAGSNRGLTLAAELPAGGPLYLPEGASDTAALLAVGACAVGRPMAVPTGWVERWLLELLHERPPDRPVIVVGDNDGDVAKTPAGLRGAEDLARRLGTAFPGQVSVALPPAQFKDVRAMVIAGAWGRGLVQKGGGA